METKNNKPHESTLRTGRWSWYNHCYFVTANAMRKEPIFADAVAAQIVIDSLCWLQDAERIRLMGFVVMTDHVHMAFVLGGRSRPECRSHNETVMADDENRGAELSDVMRSFKGYTGKKINELLQRHGEVWQPAYHDHLVRDRKDFETRLSYMHGNPVREGLSHFEHEYQHSTANTRYANLIDWAWLDGLVDDRGRKAVPTMGRSNK